MRRVIHLAAPACVAVLVAPAARADNPASLVIGPGSSAPAVTATSPELDRPNERRGGFAIGLAFGAGLASSAGYPNDQNDIGDSKYYAASGLLPGFGGGLFVLGALTDYLSFGFWFGTATASSAAWHSKGVGGGLRLELFPLYGIGGIFRDFGAFTQVGIGGTTLTYADPSAISNNGVGSFLGAGVFYEIKLARALGGHFAIGPSLEYDAIVSEPMERHGALLGVRFLWYGGK